MALKKFLAKTNIVHNELPIPEGKKFDLDDVDDGTAIESLLGVGAIEEVPVKTKKDEAPAT